MSILIHLWTSAISLAGSVVSPDRFPPHILRSKTIADVKRATYTHSENVSVYFIKYAKNIIEIDTLTWL